MIQFEENLKRAIQILNQNTQRDTATRQTAVRWFNRLYYDLAQWNKEFIHLLQDFPGLKSKPNKKELEAYRQRFREYAQQLYPYRHFDGEYNSDICARLDFLAARLDKDFATLKTEDPQTFYELERSVGRVQDLPAGFHGISSEIYDTVQRLGFELFGGYDQKAPSIEKAQEAIKSYIEDSQRILNEISEEARRVGLLLLSVTEYDEALHREGSLNPQLYVIGEVAMSGDTFNVDNRGGIFNAKSALKDVQQSISAAQFMPEEDRAVLKSLLAELETALAPVVATSPDDAKRVLMQVEAAAQELARPKPDGGLLKITSQGIKHAATAVMNIAPPVLSVADKIIDFISKYF